MPHGFAFGFQHENESVSMQFSLPKPVLRALILSFSGLFIMACNKFEGDQEVPAYLRIDTISLQTDYYLEGSNTHQITDAWIFVDDQNIGVFELPALFPVLQHGKHKLTIYPGIKLNGISSTRVPYPFYQPYEIKEYTFFPDSIRTIHPSTTYYSTANFAWKEDFENSGSSLEATSHSDTTLMRTEPNSEDALLGEFSAYSGKIVLDTAHPSIDLASMSAFDLPGRGTPVLLELDCKSEIPLLVGMFATENGSIVDIPLIYISESEKWNKLYVNLGPNVSEHQAATDFKVYFSATLKDQETASIFLDNIKLLYRSEQ